MACPDCASPARDLRFATSVETHGLDYGPYETFNEEFIVCRECGGRHDIRDWEDAPELRPATRTPLRPIETATPRPNCVQSDGRTDLRCAHANRFPQVTGAEWSGKQEFKHPA